MAAITSQADGNWSAAGTWVGGVPPGDGDTAIINTHNIVVDVNTTVGSDVGAAITTAATNPDIKTFTVNAGVTLTVKGDFNCDALSLYRIILEAGSTFKFYPSNGVSLKFDFESFDYIRCNGTSGSHVTVTTDKSRGGLNSIMTLAARAGFYLCTYTDFVNFGTAAAFGIQSSGSTTNPTYDVDFSLTNCTFTGCNYSFTGAADFDDDFTFQNNTFASSIAIDVGGISGNCASITFGGAGTAGTWLADTNGFDKACYLGTFRTRLQFSNNVSASCFINGGSWATAAKFDGNIITECVTQPIYGPIQNCYFYTTITSNPHWLGAFVSGVSILDSVFDPPDSVLGDGDIISFEAAAGACTVTGNLALSRSNLSAGKLANGGVGMTSGALTVNHNTFLGLSEQGLIGLGETSSSYAGQVASCRSNLVYASTAGSSCLVIHDQDATPGTDVVVVSAYNATRNASTGTCLYNTSTSQNGVVGYHNLKTAENNDYPNASAGTNDITITADPFVASTRNLKKWAAYKGQAETDAAGIAYAVANPAAATDATTGLRAWVRAGFNVTGAAGALLDGAGHDAVTIGAMGFQASGGGDSHSRMMRLLRP